MSSRKKTQPFPSSKDWRDFATKVVSFSFNVAMYTVSAGFAILVVVLGSLQSEDVGVVVFSWAVGLLTVLLYRRYCTAHHIFPSLLENREIGTNKQWSSALVWAQGTALCFYCVAYLQQGASLYITHSYTLLPGVYLVTAISTLAVFALFGTMMAIMASATILIKLGMRDMIGPMYIVLAPGTLLLIGALGMSPPILNILTNTIIPYVVGAIPLLWVHYLFIEPLRHVYIKAKRPL